jgi:phosphatidylethanolamine/phosphatidyl-N-methylethanolamine N-methyltransferase
MQAIQNILELSQEYINFKEEKFIETLAWSFLCFACWIILPHLQFKYKLLSRFFGNDQGRANDFLAYFLVYTGVLRNEAFKVAMENNIKISFGKYELPVLVASYISIAYGLLLIAGSFYRLGMRNMYFGDHFGFLFKEKITAFPYNHTKDPQYVGLTLFGIGYSLVHHSPAGIFLTLFVFILYKILNLVEDRKLKIFYPDSNKKE